MVRPSDSGVCSSERTPGQELSTPVSRELLLGRDTQPLRENHKANTLPQRLKEMKKMQRDPLASTKARKAERRADEKSGLITIKPVKLDTQPTPSSSAAAGGGGFRKGGFKSAFGEAKAEGDDGLLKGAAAPNFKKAFVGDDGEKAVKGEDEESDTEDEGYEVYDPRKPTD
ncbi:hypothetical protein FGG08_002010 [Glutinoglossum americanum]|uniref:Uncharacterized protein n=1 Tax=Glutinoglossum americanum TaxID=1670608 RepID=A0A9P8I0Z2_9PEZI|nr:hypothetical protein FGG08_002010 [Glutinoglossum americanum]